MRWTCLMLAVACADGGGRELDASRLDTRRPDAGSDVEPDSGEDAPAVDGGPRLDAGSDVEMGCVAPLLECDGVCTDVSADDERCGTCDRACATAETCASGVCTLMCPGGATACAGVCVDTTMDPAHCGMCGRECAPSETCMASACVTASETTIFPAAGDARVASAGEYYFRSGDSVSGSRALGLSSVRHADLVLEVGSNTLTCDDADVRFSVNGVTAGNFTITPGMTRATQSFDFAAVSGGTYSLGLDLTRTVAGGCGSFTLPDGVSRVTLR